MLTLAARFAQTGKISAGGRGKRNRMLIELAEGVHLRLRCVVICLIALFVALPDQESDQERGASKQLAPVSPCPPWVDPKSDHVTLVQIVQPRRTQRRAEGENDMSFSAYLRRPLRLDVPILAVLI